MTVNSVLLCWGVRRGRAGGGGGGRGWLLICSTGKKWVGEGGGRLSLSVALVMLIKCRRVAERGKEGDCRTKMGRGRGVFLGKKEEKSICFCFVFFCFPVGLCLVQNMLRCRRFSGAENYEVQKILQIGCERRVV